MRKAFRVAAALIVLALAIVVLVHTGPVRQFALRRAIATVSEQFGIRVEARELWYDLFALRIELRDVRLAAAESGEPPFFTARRVSVELPTSAVLGPFAIESLVVDEGRVRLVRDEAGRTNLPAPGRDNGASEPLRFGSMIARGLAIDVADAQTRSALVLPAIDVTLSADAGRVHLREPGRVTREDVTTRVHEMRGGIRFDGRVMGLSNLKVRTDELTAALTGDVALLVEEPRVDIDVRGVADAARLRRWAGPGDSPRGEIAVTAKVTGPFDALTSVLRFDSPQLSYRSFALSGFEGMATVSSTAVRVDRLAARFAGGQVNATGAVPLEDGDARVNVNWSGVDIEAFTRMLDEATVPRPTGRADGALVARGPVRDLAQWVAEGHVHMREGRTAPNRIGVAGRLYWDVQRGHWSLGAPQPVLIGGIALRPTVGGRIDFHALERSTISGLVELLRTDVRHATAVLRRVGVVTHDVPQIDGTLDAQAKVSGRVIRPHVEVTADTRIADVAQLSPGIPLHSAAFIGLKSDLRTAHIEASLPGVPAFVDAVVELQPPYVARGEVTAAGVELEKILRDVAPVPVAGTVVATARGSGPLTRWQDARVDIQVDSLDATVGALPVRLAAPARASVNAAIADILSLELIVGETRASATGRLPLTETASSPTADDALLITATGSLDQFIAATAATRMVKLPDLTGSGPAALLARVTGSAERPRIAADLELGPGTIQTTGLPPVTNLTMRVHSDGARIDLRELRAEWQGAAVHARGSAPIELRTGRGGATTVAARLTSVTPRVLEPFVDADTLTQIEGSVDATLEIQARSFDVNDLSGEVRLDRMELRVADLPIAQREPTRVTIRDGFAEVATWQWTGQGGGAGLHGRVRLSDRSTALIADGRFDLRMLTPFTRAAGVTVAGAVAPRLSITGTLDNPRIDGVMPVTGAEMRLRDPRVVATGLEGRVVLTGTSANIDALSGTVNGGSLSGSGSASYSQAGSLDASLGLSVKGMALEFPEGLRSELDADVRVTAGKISGSVTIVRSAYREPIAVAGALLTAWRTRRLAVEASPAEATFVDNLALDVRLATSDADVVVDNNIGRLALAADLRIIGTVAAPALSGRAQLAEGGQLFLGRNRYEITSGTIDFVNPVAIQPELNIVATTTSGGEDIQLTITGPADQPELNATSVSDPELGQADVFSLLLTGRRLDEIGGDEAEIVGEQALAFVSGDVLGLASRAVGLDVIRLGGVEQSSGRDLTTEVDPTARLTFGKSVGRDLDVTFSQGLRDADAQTWIVDYRPWRQVEVRFISDDENLRSFAFRHDVAFGGASLTNAPSASRPPRSRPRVESVTISGARTVEERRLRNALEVEAGDEFDFALWQRDRDRLETLLRDEGFCEARVSSRHDGDLTVTLTHAIAEGPRCMIEAQGYTLGEDTMAALQREWAQSVFDDFLVEESRAIVARSLARDGHLQARVDASISADGTRKTLSIRIEPGPSVSVRRIRFEGVEAPLEAELHEWALTRSAAEPTDDPRGFERAVTAWLRARGHARATVTVGVPLVEAAEAVVPVTVDAGPAYTLADVRVEGAQAIAANDLMETSGLLAGMPFDPGAIETARDRLQARYRRDGFSAAHVAAKSSVDEQSRTVAVTFAVSEGSRQVLRDVNVSGNRAIDPDVITRALDLTVGEPVTLDDWLQARRRLLETGLFRRADVTPEPLDGSARSNAEEPMRARVVVQEWPSVRFRYGFQVAEEHPEDEVSGRDVAPGVSADITRRTLFGRAVTVGAALDYQRREQSGRTFLSSRTMLGWPIESTFLIERSRERFASADLVTHLTRASWEQRVRAWEDLQLSYSYRFERNRTFRTTVRPGDDFGFDLTIKLAVLNTTVAWDTRDNVADPSRGWLVSSSFEWAPAALGTDFRFVKHLAQGYYFQPWRGVVFASAARLGLAAPLDEQDLVPSERYYAGGARTVRGVAEDSLGPTLFFGDAAGGESLLVLNQEVRFPVYRWLRAAAFVDAGNVFAETSAIAFGDLVTSYGAGLRLATPFALIRVDYGRLFSPSAGQSSSGRWTFGIGQAF